MKFKSLDVHFAVLNSHYNELSQIYSNGELNHLHHGFVYNKYNYGIHIYICDNNPKIGDYVLVPRTKSYRNSPNELGIIIGEDKASFIVKTSETSTFKFSKKYCKKIIASTCQKINCLMISNIFLIDYVEQFGTENQINNVLVRKDRNEYLSLCNSIILPEYDYNYTYKEVLEMLKKYNSGSITPDKFLQKYTSE